MNQKGGNKNEKSKEKRENEERKWLRRSKELLKEKEKGYDEERNKLEINRSVHQELINLGKERK